MRFFTLTLILTALFANSFMANPASANCHAKIEAFREKLDMVPTDNPKRQKLTGMFNKAEEFQDDKKKIKKCGNILKKANKLLKGALKQAKKGGEEKSKDKISRSKISAKPAAAPSGIAGGDLYLIDAHSQIDHLVDRSKIVPLMDEAGIRHVILSTRGKVKPGQIIKFAAKHPDRITASVRSKGGHYNSASPKWFKFMKKQLSMPGFGAMAEVIMWHAQKGNKAPQVVVPPDDKRVQVALKGALAKGWPFIIHIEFAASQSAETFMTKMEAMLDEHPKHPFALIHMGQLKPDEAERLLEKHPNFHFLISWANPVAIRLTNQPWTDLFDGEALTPEWKALFVEFPNRFILNFDNVFEEHWGTLYVRQAALWRKALSDLPPAVAHAVAHGNAERLWRLPTAN